MRLCQRGQGQRCVTRLTFHLQQFQVSSLQTGMLVGVGQVPYRQVYGDRGMVGGEGLWLYINKVLVVEIVSTGSGS